MLPVSWLDAMEIDDQKYNDTEFLPTPKLGSKKQVGGFCFWTMSHLGSFLQRCSRSAKILNILPQRAYSHKFPKLYYKGRRDSYAQLECDENSMLCFLRVIECGNYAICRSRPLNPDLNPETVTMLRFTPSRAPINYGNMPTCSNYATVYLVGTNHFSKESQKDVKETILQTQPDVVMVELCAFRYRYILEEELRCFQENSKSGKFMNLLRSIKQYGLLSGYRMYRMEAEDARKRQELGTENGGEFRAAFNASLEVPSCHFVLGDRFFPITCMRFPRQSTLQKLKRWFSARNDNPEKYGKTLAERVERSKKQDALEELSKEWTRNTPQLHKVLVEERDQYMTHILHTLLERTTAQKIAACEKAGLRYEPVTIVAVVGIGHIAGMKARWNTNLHKDDFRKLLSFPMPRRIPKIIKWMLEAAVCCGIAYVCYLQFAVSEGNEKVSEADEELLAISDEDEY
ncbi:traB family domain-containing protein [Ditylenchus destructor]|nr:traB family domain-containing protein [Ditylenchus destructor]